MGKIKDMFSAQIKGYSRYEKKKRQDKTEPRLINYDITDNEIKQNGLSDYNFIVTDILDANDNKYIKTKAKSVDEKGWILDIICPICGKKISLNRHWNAYICCNNHDKKIFEITNIKHYMEGKPRQIKELKEGW